MKQTSIQAYKEIQNDGTELSQMDTILKHIRSCKRGTTRNRISRELNLPINSVCGRVNSLLKKGLIREVGIWRDPITNKQNKKLMGYRYYE